MEKNQKNLTVNRSNLFNVLLLTVIVTLLIPVMANAQGKANFAGTWTLNESKSDQGQNGGRRFGGGDFTAKQDANTLTVERSFTTQNGDTRNMSSTYTLNGKETTNSTGRGESKSTATWSSDGKTLTIVTKRSFNGNDRTSTEVWTLKDAKTLSIVSTRQGRDGEEVKTTRVYDKK